MSEARTLLEQAARCRRIARVCMTAAIARKFEALAKDYEEHARLLGGVNANAGDPPSVAVHEPRTAERAPLDAAGAPQKRTVATG